MFKYSIYVDVNDKNDLLLPHKADEMGFGISAIQHGTTRRLVYKENLDTFSSHQELFNLEEIEKSLNVTVKRYEDTEEIIAGIECDSVSPFKVTELQQWLNKQSEESSNYHLSSKHEWKHFSDIDGLIEKINSNINISSRLATSPNEVFEWLANSEELSKINEERLWEAAQKVDETVIWETAEKLAITNPEYPFASVRRAKEFQIGDRRFVLAASILKRAINEQVFVLFKIYSLEKEKMLPARLKLLPLDEKGQSVIDGGEVYQITTNGEQSEISLPISCEKGERFIMEISLDDWKAHEYFVA